MTRLLLIVEVIALLSISFRAEAATKINIRVGDKVLAAELEGNATTRALVKMFPLKLKMDDLYGREMCYHLKDALPTEKLRSDAYGVGDLIYWPPRHSLVILYKQTGERFEKQHLGRVVSGVEIFEKTGDAEVRYEKVE